MTHSDQQTIDTTLNQLRAVHANMGNLWDAETMATFYYSVLSGTVARNGPEVAKAISSMTAEVFDNASKSHANLGSLTNGLPHRGPASSDESSSLR
ncbi:hypothetical protein IC235_10995 [Hymenobacter sp. BT664]|uniref:Uncharacterized protein n=1 Tax=Hymenobacter montanus TaxID=2771359 RepID=A0A927BE48_9BACT|nr:hypothetical protein [Hymenobacter montanus]MBD2768419.1 hypothetical protein [Hymenobacter montanus]